jgi:hypothetical protein
VSSIASLPEPEPEGPSLAELAEIEAEWPVIEAEMALVDAEVAVLTGPHRPGRQRLRAAERDVVAAWVVFAARWGRNGRAVA